MQSWTVHATRFFRPDADASQCGRFGTTTTCAPARQEEELRDADADADVGGGEPMLLSRWSMWLARPEIRDSISPLVI